LTDRGFTGGNEVKEERIEGERFSGVKIVNAGTWDEDVTVKIVITRICEGKVDIVGNAGREIGQSELITKRAKGTKEEVRGNGGAACR
jgi:hypothetical protein